MISLPLNGVPPRISCIFPRSFCYWRCFWPQSSTHFTSRLAQVILYIPIPYSDLLESIMDGTGPSHHRPTISVCVSLCAPRRSRTLSIYQWPSVRFFASQGIKYSFTCLSIHMQSHQANCQNGSTRLVATCHNRHRTSCNHEMGKGAIPESPPKRSQMGLDDWSCLAYSVSCPPGKYLPSFIVSSPFDFGRVRRQFVISIVYSFSSFLLSLSAWQFGFPRYLRTQQKKTKASWTPSTIELDVLFRHLNYGVRYEIGV